ncbi:hypothetical protein PR048_025556 [Dryococelus australis]|uniref:Uncharacterized protein n=1 Tax=Dryococelus australis TaxID=614101 RepID=A0ABQ9GRL2_9NEOP|nr:hypothetical protein PR048_025556 [Dryococelus australis]
MKYGQYNRFSLIWWMAVSKFLDSFTRSQVFPGNADLQHIHMTGLLPTAMDITKTAYGASKHYDIILQTITDKVKGRREVKSKSHGRPTVF